MITSGGTRPVAPPSGRPVAGSVARSSATVAAWTLVSRATGLLRVVVIGVVLGPTFLANTFLATNQVPNLTYSVVAGPVLALVVVPTVVRAMLERGPVACALFVRRLSGLLLAASGAVVLALVPISLLLAWVLTLGVPEAERGRARTIAVVLLLLMAVQVLLYTVAALGAAVQQSQERYALAAAAPALENVGLMATMAAVAVLYRPGADIGTVPFGMVVLLGAGATLSVAVHAAVQVAGAARVGLSLRPARDWRADPEVREVATRLRASILVAAQPAGSFFVLVAVASTMPGGVLVLQMAYAVYGLPTALGARAVTTAVMPRMSAAAQGGDRAGYAAGWRQALSYAATAGLPALAMLVVFSGTIAATLALGELNSVALVTSLGVCIAILGVAQVGNGIYEIGRQALFARLDTRGPRVGGWVAFGVTACAAVGALLLPAGLPRLAGLSVAMLLADLASAATVVALVRRAIRPEPVLDVRRLRAVGLAVCAMLPVLGAGWLLARDGDGWLRDLTVLVGSAALAMAVFAVTLSSLTGRRKAAP
jgi:putative peptidoglycan lipid II flippase